MKRRPLPSPQDWAEVILPLIARVQAPVRRLRTLRHVRVLPATRPKQVKG